MLVLLYLKLSIIYLFYTDHWNEIKVLNVHDSTSNTINDIWAGDGIKKNFHFFSVKGNLGLSIFTDGVPLFKSSAISFWPVYAVILNLPPSIRYNAANIMLLAIWCGPNKPSMQLLFQPVIEALNSLYSKGIEVQTVEGPKKVHAMVLNGIFDTVAKAPVMGMKQFNGTCGCPVCLHPGKRLPNNARIYLPDQEYMRRTHEEMCDIAMAVESSGISEQGILTSSPLSLITGFDLIEKIPIDYMHAVPEGIVKRLMNCWFNKSNHRKPFYLGSKLKSLDSELLKQKPPHDFTRAPRSIQKHMKHWKASEFRVWLLFYSLPLHLNKLPPLFYHHYALLVCALHLLLQEDLKISDIDVAEEMLKDFCALLPELYGKENCTFNAHLLLHLTYYVRLWGPLWTHSAFGCENKNGVIKNLSHSKYKILNQIIFNIEVQQLVHHALAQQEDAETMNFINESSHFMPSNLEELDKHVYLLPTSFQYNFEGHDVYGKLLKNGTLYCAQNCSRSTKRDSSVCYYKDDAGMHYGRILAFVKMDPPSAVVRPFSVNSTQSLLSRAGPACRDILQIYKDEDILGAYNLFSEVAEQSNESLIPICNIITRAVLVQVKHKTFAVRQPNLYEHH